MSAVPAETRTLVTPPGGIMTREAGAITGDVEVWIKPENPAQAGIRYIDADDMYTVRGNVEGRTIDQIVSRLTADPGADDDGNPIAVEL